MFGQMVFQLDRWPSLLAALALLAIALWLLWFDFETRVHRAFALLLVLKAFLIGLLAFGAQADGLAAAVRVYFAIGIPFAAFYFALVFRAHYASEVRTRPSRQWPWTLALVSVAAAFMFLYAFRRVLYRGVEGPGLLVLFFPLAYGAFAFVAFLFVRAAALEGAHERRSAFLLAALALSLEPLHQAVYQVLSIPVYLAMGAYGFSAFWLFPVFAVERFLWVAMLALIAVAALALWRADRGDARFRRDARRVLLAMLFPVGTGLLSVGAFISDWTLATRIYADFHLAVDALWVVAGATIIAYAILHHHFLDVRPQVRRAVRTSTMVGALLLVFFVAKELLEELLQGYYPVLPGLGAAIIAVLLLQPILFLVARFVRSVIPSQAVLSGLKSNERRAVYRSQVEMVWMDGVVTTKERRLLERMRERLELRAEDAQRIEAEVMRPQPGSAPLAGYGPGGKTRSRSPAR